MLRLMNAELALRQPQNQAQHVQQSASELRHPARSPSQHETGPSRASGRPFQLGPRVSIAMVISMAGMVAPNLAVPAQLQANRQTG